MNDPALANVSDADAPVDRRPVSNALLADSHALCFALSWLTHVTVSPAFMLRFDGVKAKSLITTVWVVAWPSALATVAAKGRAKEAAARRRAERRVISVISKSFVKTYTVSHEWLPV